MPEPIQIDEHGNIILKLNWKRMLKVVVILLLAWGAYYLPIPGLTHASRICMMIFIGAAGFWITEAIPPFATAMSLPISTPPNAIAFATRTVDTAEMAKSGTLVSGAGILVIQALVLLLIYLNF